MKKVILMLTGSVASIRYLDLINALGVRHELSVMFTKGSEPFINKFELSNHKLIKKVYSDEFTLEELENITHIQLAVETDLVLIAPGTYNFINSYSQGIANTFPLTFLSAMEQKKVFIAPAMNTRMYNNEILQSSLIKLQNFGCKIVEPIVGELSCGEIGIGKMEDIFKIAERVDAFLEIIPKKKVIVTCGSTKVYLDPVRYLTNKSSGKFGIEFANEFYKKNYDVHLIHGEDVNLQEVHFGIKKYEVITNLNLIEKIKELSKDSDLIIMAAAPIDYKIEEGKKKIKNSNLELNLNKDKDIIKEISDVIKFGFALESENHEKNGYEKLTKKNLDYILVNDVKTMDSDFVYDAILIEKNKKEKTKYLRILKKEIVKNIVKKIGEDFIRENKKN